ncbi:MAG TPA: hypothetical protein VJC21_01750 [Candidatus Nanoarchaeia archaeon]|nr:hypothetical protein [Candidatus Nanoarchaeia archaeon]
MLHPHIRDGKVEYALEDVLDKCHLALVDTCFIDYYPGRREFAKELYDASRSSSLHTLKALVQEGHQVLQWRLQHLVTHAKVSTIPEVLQEVQKFEEHLQSVLRWGKEPEKKRTLKPVRQDAGGKGSRRSRRSNDLTLKRSEIYEEMEEAGDGNDHIAALHLLDAFRSDLRRLQTTLQQYGGAFAAVQRNDLYSNTDFRLVEAAIGYAAAHPEELVAILTNDSDLGKILKEARETQPQYRNAAERVRAFKGTALQFVEKWYF